MAKTEFFPTPLRPANTERLTDVRGDAAEAETPEEGADGALAAASVESQYMALLSQFPEAPVAAVKREGLFVAMPVSFPVAGHPVLQGRSGLDLVIPEDRGAVIAAWDSMLARGIGRCVVHLANAPTTTRTFHFYDARPGHGVCLCVIAPADISEAETPAPLRTEIASVTPRFATIKKNERGVVIEVDDATTQILGWDAEDLLGARTLAFTHPDDHALAIENWMDLLATPGPARRVRVRYQRRDESWVWFEITNHNLLDDPEHRCVVSGMLDISDEMAANEALRAREQLLDRLAEALPLGLFQIDSGQHIVYTNDRLHEIIGVQRAQTVRAQLSNLVAEDRPALETALSAVLRLGRHGKVEVALQLPGAREHRLCTMTFRALSDDAGTITGAIVCVEDITEAARMREELKRRATFDHLTGCYNRASLMQALEADMSRSGRRAERAVIFIDLDGFKQINDSLGHATGDELLAIAAARIIGATRDEDLVGRSGGDEFLVLCPQIAGPDQAVELAERLGAELKGEIQLAAGTRTLQASIGVAWSKGDTMTADALVAQADAAMYRSKRLGTGRPQLAVERLES